MQVFVLEAGCKYGHAALVDLIYPLINRFPMPLNLLPGHGLWIRRHAALWLLSHMPKPLMFADEYVGPRPVNVLRILDANLAAGHASGQVVVDCPANVVV